MKRTGHLIGLYSFKPHLFSKGFTSAAVKLQFVSGDAALIDSGPTY